MRKIFCIFIGIFLNVSVIAAETNFLSLTDIHFDPFVDCYQAKTLPCPIIKKLQQAPASQWKQIFLENEPEISGYRQDTNYLLLSSMLKYAKQSTEGKDIKFILQLGDILGHDYHYYYRKYSLDVTQQGFEAFVKKTLSFINAEIQNTFPQINIYQVIGNNDVYTRDYEVNPNGAFFHDAAQIWSQSIYDNAPKKEFLKEFPYLGFYAFTLPSNPKIRLIALNTVAFSIKTEKVLNDVAENELEWFDQQLHIAQMHQQKVFIIMHISPSIDLYFGQRYRIITLLKMWRNDTIQKFKFILQQHQADILALFAGHLHSDWSEIWSFDKNHEIPISGTPSISPIFGNNPGFKIYSFSENPFSVNKTNSYYMHLRSKKTLGFVQHI